MIQHKERRIHSRAELRWPVSVVTAEGAIQGETRNISMQGAFICCQKPLCPNERFLLTVNGPSGSLQVLSKVVWSNICACDDETGPSGMGVSFVWSSHKQQGGCMVASPD
ncbi:MAG: PilZ domain-containing protein [Deltaproteobacteria bacterium]|nr:MAG: PilZ domain-containing protein [Deltaproteobacteria bacterium]